MHAHLPIVLPEPVVEPVALNRLKSFEVQHALGELLTGWIPVDAGLQVCFARFQNALQQHSSTSVFLQHQDLSGMANTPLVMLRECCLI